MVLVEWKAGYSEIVSKHVFEGLMKVKKRFIYSYQFM